jgi:signal transduction histidine kinase
MNALLSDLLAFQQPRPPNIQLLRVGPILENCVRFAKPQAGNQEVDVRLTGDLSQSTLVDEQYFRQIMLNLILNAIDVSKSGEQVLVNATAADGSIAIEVSDRGPGLTLEQQEHLFEPFYTTKTTGHGLGLAVSRELAQSMGASLSWRNEPAHGATFILQLTSSKLQEEPWTTTEPS